jgi:hypothetical protein
MNNKRFIYSATCFLTFVLAASLWAHGNSDTASNSNAVKWHHLAFEQEGDGISNDPELARKINRLGNEGWELVDVETIIKSGTTQKSTYFFKRPQ